jgi:hypothetical protein
VPFGPGRARRRGGGGEAAGDFSRRKRGGGLRVAAFHGAPTVEPGPVQPGRARGNHARRALETLARYLQLHSELLSIRIEDAGELVILRADIVRGSRMPRRQGIELFVGYLFRILQELLGPSWKARRVLFMHPAPASLSRHVAMFGRIVDFDAEFNGIVCGAADLAGCFRPRIRSWRDMHASTWMRWSPAGHDTRGQGPLAGARDAAAGPLQRREGGAAPRCRSTHRAPASCAERRDVLLLVDDVRGELAEGYLEGNKARLTDVADLLGFSALSAFSRWHKRHFGFTLTERRNGRSPP